MVGVTFYDVLPPYTVFSSLTLTNTNIPTTEGIPPSTGLNYQIPALLTPAVGSSGSIFTPTAVGTPNSSIVLNDGDFVTYTLVVTIVDSAPIGTVINNCFTATNIATTVCAATVTVIAPPAASADLSVLLSGPESTYREIPTNYSLDVFNNGPDPATMYHSSSALTPPMLNPN